MGREDKTIKILIVDDSKAMQTIVRRGLLAMGYDNLEIRQANDGAEALDIVREWDAQLIISDWHMPTMNGFQLAEAINKEMLGIDFGFVTTESSEVKLKAAIEVGAKFIVKKPFDFSTLHEAVLPILQGSSKANDALVSSQEEKQSVAGRIVLPQTSVTAKIINGMTKREVLMEVAEEAQNIEDHMPCLLGLYGGSNKKVLAVAILDVHAASILGAAVDDLSDEEVHIATVEKAIPKKLIANSESVLDVLGTAFFDKQTNQPLELLSVNIVRHTTPALETLTSNLSKERVDFEMAAIGYGTGNLTLITA
jgi:CheY-like chemotaxis protein